MTGRGRPRKARSPENKCAKSKTRPEEMKEVSLPRSQREDLSEEKHDRTTKDKELKESEQKKKTCTRKKPSAQGMQTETTTKQFTEEKKEKLQRTPKDNTKAPVTKAKTKVKATAQSAQEIKMQPESLKDTTKGSSRIPKVKTCGDNTKSPVEFVQETTRPKSETQQDTKKASTKSTKATTRAGKVKLTDKFTEETAKMEPETSKYTTNACLMQDICKDGAAGDSILHKTLQKLKIKRNEKANAAEVINEIKRKIIKHLKENTVCFKEVEEPLGTGSYYENVKISNPDEFDVMVPIPVDRVNIEQFRDDGAFYSVALKRGKSPLQKFQENDTLSASKMLDEFRDEVKKCVKPFTEWTVTRKKTGSPAVTLTTNVQSVTISLDVVLCLMVKSAWPPFTHEGLKIDSWLGTKVKQEFKRKPYYLVPKYEGKGTVKSDGVLAKDVWRVSFSHIEKAILRNHGSEKTCCETDGERCCRKDCLKLLKHLLSLLKTKDSSFDKFCSYHVKTTLLHACCSRTKDSDWRASSLSQCFQKLLEDFIGYLEKGVLHNFFIPRHNLLSDADQKRCNSLACCIREERDKGFPIFK